MRGTIGSGRQFQSTHNYDPYGNPDTTITGFAFTGEPRDTNGLQYHRARYYHPSLAGWLSLDSYPGTMARPMSLNGYAYVEGNTPNRTDPSGKCWDNPGTPSNQQSQCLEAWVNYASGIDLNDPTYRELLRQEDAYWRGLPYQDFTRLWNDNRARPPLSMKTRSNNAGNIMSSAVGVAGTVSFVNPFPGPEDAVAGGILIGGACLAAGAALVGALVGTGTVSLLDRPFYSFRLPQEPPEFPNMPIDPTLGLDQDDYERLGDALVHGVRGAGNLINTFASSTSNTQSQSNTSSSRYGNCTPQQHDALAQIVRDRCKSSIILGCAEKKGLKKLRQRLRSVQGVRRERDVVITRDHIQTIIDDNLACEAARQAVQDTCYPNSPSEGHEERIQALQDARQKCQDLLTNM